MRKAIGIDRRVKRAWLDATLDRLAQDSKGSSLRGFLNDHLVHELPGKESRAKTAGVILRIWSGIAPGRASLRDRAIALLPRISGQERIWLHWGMAALAYPFFRDAAEVVGRLLALQDDFSTAQVQARMLTNWGDRVTTKEAAQKIVTTMVDWEVLRTTKTRGRFLPSRKVTASLPELQLWLLEALLGASDAEETEAQQLLRLPTAFPFVIGIGVADLRRREEFNIHRQGLDMDMVSLRTLRSESVRRRSPKERIKCSASDSVLSLFDASEPSIARPAKPRSPSRLITSNGGVSDPEIATEDRQSAEPFKDKAATKTSSGRAARRRKPQQLEGIADDRPYASPRAECEKLFHDESYFACVALARAILEAAIYEGRISGKRTGDRRSMGSSSRPPVTKHLEANLRARHEASLMNLHSPYRLDPSIAGDRQKLRDIARLSIELLADVDKALFGPPDPLALLKQCAR